MIHYLPLELVPTRYMVHLDRSISDYLAGRDALRYYPDMQGRETTPPGPGFFLNAPTTIEFKARQIGLLAKAWAEGQVEEGDIIFTSDLWMPGIEAVAYLSFFTKTRVRLRGLLHAGSFTDGDWVRRFERWASLQENVWFDIAERVFVGSESLKGDVCSRRLLDPAKVTVQPLPLDPALNEVPARPFDARDRLVVFTARDTPEKQPHLFRALADDMEGEAEFIWTSKVTRGKEDYYRLLARAQVVVSFALEETFGFAIQEAVRLGCVPVVPDRLCYPEQFDLAYRYRDLDECRRKVRAALDGKLLSPPVKMNAEAPEVWFS